MHHLHENVLSCIWNSTVYIISFSIGIQMNNYPNKNYGFNVSFSFTSSFKTVLLLFWLLFLMLHWFFFFFTSDFGLNNVSYRNEGCSGDLVIMHSLQIIWSWPSAWLNRFQEGVSFLPCRSSRLLIFFNEKSFLNSQTK